MRANPNSLLTCDHFTPHSSFCRTCPHAKPHWCDAPGRTRGCRRTMSFRPGHLFEVMCRPAKDICPDCKGFGFLKDTGPTKCAKCAGKGQAKRAGKSSGTA